MSLKQTTYPRYCDEERLGARVRRARASAGYSQRDLAERAGVTGAYISRIEAGERIPALQILHAIAEATDVRNDWLAWGRETGATCPHCGGELE